jgi:hypothetical protein
MASGTDIGHANTGNLSSGAANFDTATSPTLTYGVTSAVRASAAVAIKAFGAAAPPASLAHR